MVDVKDLDIETAMMVNEAYEEGYKKGIDEGWNRLCERMKSISERHPEFNEMLREEALIFGAKALNRAYSVIEREEALRKKKEELEND